MMYKKGDKVKHPKQEVWGVGVVLENQHDDKVRIFFEHIGEKILSTKFISPTKVSKSEAKKSLLDAFKESSQTSGLVLLLHNFLLKFPEGFQDQDFRNKVVAEKEKISKEVTKLLSKKVFSTLIEQSKYSELSDLIKKTIEKDTIGMISAFEKSEFLNHLETAGFHVELADALFSIIYDEGESFEQSFLDLSEVLVDMKSGKWQILTYFLFIFHPKKYSFLNPVMTQHIAKLCEFDLKYDAELNFNTYQQALMLSQYLYDRLIELGEKPKDLLDIQSFMWVVEKN